MKIYVMTDMEGVCGVINHDDWVMPDGRYYDEGRGLLTGEINAACRGLFKAGAKEITVADGHGAGGIIQILLDERTKYIRGFPKPYPFELDGSFDAICWVGQHAKAGTPLAHLAHTGWFNVLDCTINGISVGEFGEMALCAAYLGVTPIFGSGDRAFCREAEDLVPGIVTVSVKEGITEGRGDEYDTQGYRNRNLAAIHLHPKRAQKLIEEGAEEALQKFIKSRESFVVPEIKAPFKKITTYRPDGNRPSHRTVASHKTDLIEMMNAKEVIL